MASAEFGSLPLIQYVPAKTVGFRSHQVREMVRSYKNKDVIMILRNKAEEAANDILRAFENPNDLPRPLAQVFINRKDGSPCRQWSWRNQLIAAIRGHSDARGFRQWEKVCRKVRKGEKSFRILSPLMKKELDEKKKEERTIIYGFTGTPVFGLAQTEGERMPTRKEETERWLESLPLREVADAWELSVEAYNGKEASVLGQYRHGSAIALGVKSVSTWCHELVHAADDRTTSLKGRKLSQETVAELGGAVLLTILGHEHESDLGGCWEYINRYASKEGKDVLTVCGKLLDRTCDAVGLILDTAFDLRAISET